MNTGYDQKLKDIVNFSYATLQNKINGGRINVENETSLQLHFSAILKTVGELYEYSRNDLFSIELEKPVSLADGTFNKSGSQKAKIDIFLSLENLETKKKHSCSIELKFFKKANLREPNNRYDVFKDIHNLESYGAFSDIGYMIVATDHAHYVNKENYSPDTADFDFRNGKSYTAGTTLVYRTAKPYGPPVVLSNSYDFSWNEVAGGIQFLKLEVSPVKSEQEQ